MECSLNKYIEYWPKAQYDKATISGLDHMIAKVDPGGGGTCPPPLASLTV